MKIHWRLGLLVLVFALGLFASELHAAIQPDPANTYAREEARTPLLSSLLNGPSRELLSPHDWVSEEQIRVYADKVEIDLSEFGRQLQWATFTDTNSMDPLLDEGTNAIEFIPRGEEDIHIGDVVSYESPYASGPIIHRVIAKGADKDGLYYIVQGDNNPDPDPGKVRFPQIKRVLLAVIY